MRDVSPGMSSIVPTTPGLITGAPTRDGSGSTKPTMSTPSSCRRSNSSRASTIAAGLVPTSNSRSRGISRDVITSNADRHAITVTIASAAVIRNTPCSTTSSGNSQ